jgi:hypothetical protein
MGWINEATILPSTATPSDDDMGVILVDIIAVRGSFTSSNIGYNQPLSSLSSILITDDWNPYLSSLIQFLLLNQCSADEEMYPLGQSVSKTHQSKDMENILCRVLSQMNSALSVDGTCIQKIEPTKESRLLPLFRSAPPCEDSKQDLFWMKEDSTIQYNASSDDETWYQTFFQEQKMSEQNERMNEILIMKDADENSDHSGEVDNTIEQEEDDDDCFENDYPMEVWNTVQSLVEFVTV